ncbi:DUF3093 domain-containing protein [Micrococcoides hystricis]|uniref:DUF3093 domain-containing protein n=1 Tax=Micrococcoides hystricis TaxID=1572761 RepID=A0ABV6P6X6_9MICC
MTSADSPAAPVNGVSNEILFQEKLWPSWWLWLTAAGAVAASALVMIPMGVVTTIIGCIVVAAILALLLYFAGPTLTVTSQYFTAGRATIERKFLGEAQAFEKDEAFAQRGPKLHGLAYMCMRGWVDPVVTVPVLDPEDQTPYWIVSSRKPAELVAALNRR